MSMHRLIVASMLAVTIVLAVSYVSTFPVGGELVPADMPASLLESQQPSTAPAGRTNMDGQRSLDAEALRHFA